MEQVWTSRLGALIAFLALAGLTACNASIEDQHPDRSNMAGLCQQKNSSSGKCSIVLGVSGATPVYFEADLADMQRAPDGSVKILNQLVLVLPGDRLLLADADVSFKRSIDGRGFDRIEGEARIPFDRIPILNKAKTGGGVMAMLGYDQGKNLGQLNAPLNPQTYYLNFAFKESFAVSFGFDDLGIPVRGGEGASKPFKFTPVPEAQLVMALDVSDPFFYVSAKGLSPKKKDKDKDKDKDKKKKASLNIGGFGFSYHNRIPQRIDTLEFQKSILGTLLLEGSVPFPPAPVIQYNGYYLVGNKGLMQAIDGDIRFGMPLKFLLSFSISLGKATAIVDGEKDMTEVFMAGQYRPDTSWLPEKIPLIPDQEVQMVVRLNSANESDTYVHGLGRFEIIGSKFAPKGLQFDKVLSQKGEFRITSERLEMKGSIDRDFYPFQFKENARFNATVSSKPEEDLFEIDGGIRIGPLDGNGSLTITPSAVALATQINAAGDWRMAVQGKLYDVADQGLRLAGEFTVPDYLNNRVAGAITGQVNQTRQDLQQRISELTKQLKKLTLDLPSVRKAAVIAATAALNDMNTKHDGSLINQEINKQCKWVPECPQLARNYFNRDKQVKQVMKQLNVIKELKQKDDDSARRILKLALLRVIDSKPIIIDLKLKALKIDYLNPKNRKTLRTAYEHFDKLKTTSGKKVDVEQELEGFTKSELSRLARKIEQGVNPINVKHMGFDIPATTSGPIQLSILMEMDGKPNADPVIVSFDPTIPQQLPLEIVKKIGNQVASYRKRVTQ